MDWEYRCDLHNVPLLVPTGGMWHDDSYASSVAADSYSQVTFSTKDLRFRMRVGGKQMFLVQKLPSKFFGVSSDTFALSDCY